MVRSSDCPDSAVLVVDSNPSAVKLLVSSFAHLGYTVVPAIDLENALVHWRNGTTGLAIVDLTRQPRVAFQMALEMKRTSPARPVVAVSAAPSVATAVRAIRMGLDSYLAKPTSAAEILTSLDRRPASAFPEQEGEVRSLTLDEAIWEHISHTVVTSPSFAEAARRLGVERRSLRRMVDKYAPKG